MLTICKNDSIFWPSTYLDLHISITEQVHRPNDLTVIYIRDVNATEHSVN